MPSLRAFGRQFTIGSDDLPLPSFLGLVHRVGIVCLAVLSLSSIESALTAETLTCSIDDDGDDESLDSLGEKLSIVRTFGVGCAVLCFVSGAVCGLALLHSLRGTIVDDEKRKYIAPLLKTFTVLLLVETGWSIFGTLQVFSAIPECDEHEGLSNSFWALRAVVATIWLNALFFFSCGWLTASNRRVTIETDHEYMRLDETSEVIDAVEHGSDDEGMSWSVTRHVWERRCRRMCCVFQLCTCNLFGGAANEASDETYRNVANIMARFFKGMDVVPSDLISALCLLRAEQRSLEAKAVQAIIRKRLQRSLRSSNSGGELDDDQEYDLEAGTPSSAYSSTSATPPRIGSAFTNANPFHNWLWNDSDVRARAKSRIRVQHFSKSHVALDAQAKQLLASSAHFSPFMLGIYGKLLYTYMNLVTGPCELLCSWKKGSHHADHQRNAERRFLRRAPTYESNVMDDDCCSLNYSALRLNISQRLSTSIVFANFSNKVHESPYCIAIDNETETVVLSIRGTLSAADMLIDAIVTPRSLQPSAEKWGFQDWVDQNSHAHGGMLRTADTIRTDIENRGILKALFRGTTADSDYGSTTHRHASNASGERGFGADELHEESSGVYVHNLDTLPDCRGFKFKVIGHSLGAGVASILSLMLLPEYPDLHVLAYSPPGCIFDYALAQRSEKWIDSIFVGNDLVPHASWRSLLKLRGQMLECLRRSKVNKPSALRSLLSNTHADELMYPEDRVPNTFARHQLALKIKKLQLQAEGNDFLSKTPMYAPGRLLHIMRTETLEGTCCKGSSDVYLPVWVSDRKVLDEFIISRKMALDHFPNTVAQVLQSVAEEHCTLRDGPLRSMMVV